MKIILKIFLLFILVIFFAFGNKSFGQATLPSNILTGLQDAPAQFLGSITAHDVIFRSNNAERFRIVQGSGLIKLSTSTNLVGNVVGGFKILGDVGNTPASPAYGFNSTDVGIGMYRPVPNTIAFSIAGAERLRISNNGYLGIGSIDPIQTLDVNGRVNIRSGVIQKGGTAITTTSDLGLYSRDATTGIRLVTNSQPIKFYSDGGTNPIGITPLMTILANGNTGLGTVSPIQLLDVNGRLNIQNGVIQKGGAAITSTSDLGLYSRDATTGIRFVTNSQPINFYSDGGTNPVGVSPLMTILSSGKIGIGSAAPDQLLDINGRMRIRNGVIQKGGSAIATTNDLGLYSLDANWIRIVTNSQPIKFFTDGSVDPIGSVQVLSLEPSKNITASINGNPLDDTKLYIETSSGVSGKAGVVSKSTYTTPWGYGVISAFPTSQFKAFAAINYNTNEEVFQVRGDGLVLAKEIKVRMTPFPDYVFSKEHNLMTLENLEQYITINKHLPNIPSSAEVEENGIGVGELQMKHMEKIEELTLYIIQLKKEIDNLKDQVNEIKSK